MTTNVMYSREVIRRAVEAVPPAQLEALTSFFAGLSKPAADPDDALSDEEYAECLAIVNGADKEEWYDIDAIGGGSR